MIADMKAEKYLISSEIGGTTSVRIRYGFGAAGEEVQKLLENEGLIRIRVNIEGERREVQFFPGGRALRLVDIKARLKTLSFTGE
ncbi:MAG TPA: hypothetical protein VFD13_06460 [Candidatus Kapabacteria bacterium]|nr:hypothetical protein [Candidatus Kapabacteria bacterium]